MNKDIVLKASQQASKPASRESNIELLRILSMIMIVFHHYAIHGGFEWNAVDITLPHFWYNFIVMWGKVGVNIFVLISGYFLSYKSLEVFNIKRVLKFEGQLLFYSIGIFGALVLIGLQDFGKKEFIISFFPITFSTWWFASAYFLLYIIAPFLNIFLNNLEKKKYQSLIIMLIILWSIVPTLTSSNFQGNSLSWFITLYILAGYIRKFEVNNKFATRRCFIYFLIISIINYLLSFIFTILGSKWKWFEFHSTYFNDMQKVPTLLISLALFIVFLNIKFKYNKWINMIAAATFGVYLISDHFMLRSILWLHIFNNYKYQNSLLLIPHSIITVICVYLVSTIIDLIRKIIFEGWYMIFVNKYADNILKLFISGMNRVCGKIL